MSSDQRTYRATLFFLWLTLVSTAGISWYEATFQHSALDPTFTASYRDAAAIYFTLCLKTLWMVLPAPVLGWLLVRKGWFRPGYSLFLGWWGLVMGFVCLEVEFQRLTGNRLVSYFGYLGDLAKNPAYLNKLGGGALLVKTFVLSVWLPALCCLLAAWLTFKLATWSVGEDGSMGRWLTVTFLAGYLPVVLLGLFCLDGFDDPKLLARVRARLPQVFRPLEPVGRALSGAILGRKLDDTDQLLEQAEQELERRLSPQFGRLVSVLTTAQPIDTEIVIPPERRRDILMVVVESSNPHFFAESERVPELNALLGTGLVAQTHYAATNASNLGVFSLIYGRDGATFDRDLDFKTPPQLNDILGRNGYKRSYFCAMAHREWQRMDEYLTPESFDYIRDDLLSKSEFTTSVTNVDRGMFQSVRDLLAKEEDEPQFVLLFPSSTHYPYSFPPDQAFYQPCEPSLNNRTRLTNRYKNSIAFMKSEILALLKTVDLDKTLVVVVGDHGEAMWEDGTGSHATRFSDGQTRTNFAMLGLGVKPMAIEQSTVHADVLPTMLHALLGGPVAMRNAHGRDLLAGPIQERPISIYPKRFGDDPHVIVTATEQARMSVVYYDAVSGRNVGRCEVGGLFDKDGLPLEGAVPSSQTLDAMVKAQEDRIEVWSDHHR